MIELLCFICFFCVSIRRPPRSTRTDTLFPPRRSSDLEYTGPAGIPMYVTENGAAFDDVVAADGSVPDADRASFLLAHLDAVAAAREAGADVQIGRAHV